MATVGYGLRTPLAYRVAAYVPGLRDALLGQAYWLPSPPGRLLDVGCGDGRQLQLLKYLGWNVVGIDVDTQAVELANRRYGLDARVADLTSFKAQSFDVVVLHHVLEHVPDLAGTLRDIKRVLVPGGRCVVVTPNAMSLGARLFGRAWVHWDPPRHLQVFTWTGLLTLLRKHGFQVVDKWTSARGARFAWTASVAIRRSPDERTWTGSPRPVQRVMGITFQLAEHLVLLPFPQLGEELVVVATTARER